MKLRTLPVVVIALCIAALVVVAGCKGVSSSPSAVPVQVPNEGYAGGDVIVKVKVAGTQPCELVLTKSYKTDVANYFSPYTSRTLAYPGIDNTVTWLQNIPWDTVPGTYLLKVVQMESPKDQEGLEIFSRPFVVK